MDRLLLAHSAVYFSITATLLYCDTSALKAAGLQTQNSRQKTRSPLRKCIRLHRDGHREHVEVCRLDKRDL